MHNDKMEDVSDYEAERRIRQLFRIHKSHTRPWWKHPRWHVHHWQVEVVPVFKLKRWLFTRCAYCGKRFRWGYASTSTTWHSNGPQWFRSERNLYHHDCYADSRAKCANEKLVKELEDGTNTISE